MCFHLVAVCSQCGVVTNPGYHLVRPCEVRAREFGTRDLMAYDDLGEHQLDVGFCREANFFYVLSIFEPKPPCRNQQCAVLTQDQMREQMREQMQHNSILTIPEVLAWLGPIPSPQDSQLLIDTAWNVVWQNGGPWFAQHDMAGNNVPTQGVQLGPPGPNPQPNLPLLVGSTPAVGQPAPNLPHLAGNQVGPSTQPQARLRRWTPEEDRRLLDLNRQGLSDKEILEQYRHDFPGRTSNSLETRRSRLKKMQQAQQASATGCNPGNTNLHRDPDPDSDADPDPSTGFGAAESVGQTAVY